MARADEIASELPDAWIPSQFANPANPEVLYRWRIENQDLHQGTGGMDVKHFKWGDRYYVVQSLQFQQGGPNPDLGAVVLDVGEQPLDDRIRNRDSEEIVVHPARRRAEVVHRPRRVAGRARNRPL